MLNYNHLLKHNKLMYLVSMPEATELPWESAFVQRMRTRRERDEMSQTELARAAASKGLAFHQQTIQRIESGIRPLRLNEAVVIAEILGSSLDEMTKSDSLESLREEAIHNAMRLGSFLDGVSKLLEQKENDLEALLQVAADARHRYLAAWSSAGSKQTGEDLFIERRVEEAHEALEVIRKSVAAWRDYEKRHAESQSDPNYQLRFPGDDDDA